MGALAVLHHSRFSPREIARSRDATVTVCVPARNEAATIGRTVSTLMGMKRQGVVDQVLVADDSTDGTPRIAEVRGAEVVRQRDLMADYGPVLGKGDAMWRALDACAGEVICFVDADSSDFDERLPCGLIGAVAVDGFAFAKGTYRRPFDDGQVRHDSGGGRVTELTAKPLLRQLAPELAAFTQPLAGEIAGRSSLLRSVPMATGYSVDVALLIDVWRSVGLAAVVEVDLDRRQNRHRPLDELAPMADEVMAAILDRTMDVPGARFGSERRLRVVNRPPFDSLELESLLASGS